MVIAGFNTAGFAVTALTQSHKITDLTVGLAAFQRPTFAVQTPLAQSRLHNPNWPSRC